jgi:hypothetical protein
MWKEPHQAGAVVTLGEPLAVHDAARHEHGIREEEPVGGHEVHGRMPGPAREQRAQDAGRRALPHRDAAGQADDEGHLGRAVAEEGLGGAVQLLRGAHVEAEQARQRQVDLLDLGDRERVVQAAQLGHVRFREGQRGAVAQLRPRRAIEREVAGGGRLRLG